MPWTSPTPSSRSEGMTLLRSLQASHPMGPQFQLMPLPEGITASTWPMKLQGCQGQWRRGSYWIVRAQWTCQIDVLSRVDGYG